MKPLLKIAIILFSFTSHNCFGQDTSSINKSWKTLKIQLQRRTDIIVNLTQPLYSSKIVDKKELIKLKKSAVDIFKYLDTLKRLDSSSIVIIRNSNNQLTTTLTKTLVSFENDKKFKNRNTVMNLVYQLEGTENDIALARREYNETCKKNNRTDLQYLTDENSRGVQVQF